MLFRLALDGRFLLYLDTINLVTSIFMYHNAQTAYLQDKADRNSCVKMSRIQNCEHGGPQV